MAQPWTSTWKTGDQPIDGYALTHALGKGAFGEVWKARDSAGRNVAVKIIDLQANPVAGKELRAFNQIKNLDHPNIVPVFTARLIPLKPIFPR